jgi:peptide/nickel transport system ATP-binding protein
VSLLDARGLDVRYRSGAREVHALQGVDLEVGAREVVGLVGESGSGKSSLARAVLGLQPLHAGCVRFEGVDLAGATRAQLTQVRRRMQPVFQDASSALDPRWTVAESLEEPLELHGVGDPRSRPARLAALLELVRLPKDLLDRRPRELSSGQRQRVNLARALALEPELLILDEPVSALDVSVQAQLLNLLASLRAARPLAMLLISHDLDVVAHLADRIVVLHQGRVIEQASTAELFAAPKEPYTKSLLAARERRLAVP